MITLIQIVFSCVVQFPMGTRAVSVNPTESIEAARYTSDTKFQSIPLSSLEMDLYTPLSKRASTLNSPSVFDVYERASLDESEPLNPPPSSNDPASISCNKNKNVATPSLASESIPAVDSDTETSQNRNGNNEIFTDATFVPVFVIPTRKLSLFMQYIFNKIDTASVFG